MNTQYENIGKLVKLIERLRLATQENKIEWDSVPLNEFHDQESTIYYAKLTASNGDRYFVYVEEVKDDESNSHIDLSLYKEGFDETGSYDNTIVGEPIKSTDPMFYADPESYSAFELDKLYNAVRLSVWEKENRYTMHILSDLLDNIG